MPAPPTIRGARLRDPGRDALPEGLHPVSALGDALTADPSQALDPALEGMPDRRAATGDAALLRLPGEHRLEVDVLLLGVLALEAGALLIEVEDGAGTAGGPAAGLLGEVAGLTRGGRAGWTVVALAERGATAGLEVVIAETEPVALVGRRAMSWGRSGESRCHCRSCARSLGSRCPGSRWPGRCRDGPRPRRIRDRAAPGRCRSLGSPCPSARGARSATPIGPGLRRSRNRSRLSCRVRRRLVPGPYPDQALACTSNLRARTDPRARPGGSRQSSIGLVAEFRVRSGAGAGAAQA